MKKMTEEERFERMQNSKWAKVMERIFNLILLNLNFILYSSIGLFIFGIGPSLLAGYQITKEYDGNSYDYTLFKKYFKAFRENFIRGNLLFWGIGAMVLIVISSITYYVGKSGLYANLGLYIMGLSAILLIFFLLVSFPIFAIYNEHKIIDRMRITIYLMLINPLEIVIIGVVIFALFSVFLLFPQFILIIGFSPSMLFIYSRVKKMILKMDVKFSQNDEKQENNE